MPDLAEWLLEQITEDERVAHELDDYRFDDDPYSSRINSNGEYIVVDFEAQRVLAECEAKRRIIGFLAGLRDSAGARRAPIDWATQCMALPYKDRPGYREEWAPQ